MNFRHIFLSLILLSVSIGCNEEDFSEINTNPNQPVEVPSSTLLPGVIRESVNASVNQSYLVGNNVMQLTAKTLRKQVDFYQWNPFANITWVPMYDALKDAREMQEVARNEENQNMEAIGMVMESWIFSVLTDAYGYVPYTEGGRGDEEITLPAYDSQEDIYMGENGLLAKLEQAAGMLGQGNGTIDGDILLGGEANMWKKFANSLRLRLLMRVANVNESMATNQMQSIIDNGDYFNPGENAVLNYTGSFPNQFPTIPLKQGDFDAVVISKTLSDTLKSLQDPRLGIYARPNNAVAVNQEGADPNYGGGVNSANDVGGSLLGYRYYDYPNHRTVSDKANGIIMLSSEIQFILAEAQEKGWVSTGSSVEDHYRSGIRSAMNYYEVSFPFNAPYVDQELTTFDDYYQQSNVDLDQADNKLARIAKQKWISLFFNGLEGWFDWKRTGLPDIDPVPNNTNDNQIPVRFVYPGQEKSLNASNYQSAVDKMGADNINTHTWWDTE